MNFFGLFLYCAHHGNVDPKYLTADIANYDVSYRKEQYWHAHSLCQESS